MIMMNNKKMLNDIILKEMKEVQDDVMIYNKKINVHIAMSQNEEHYRTILYLASPILPDTW